MHFSMSTERKTSGRVWYFYIFNITKSSDIKVELSHPLKKKLFVEQLIHNDSADDYDDEWGENLSSKFKAGWV